MDLIEWCELVLRRIADVAQRNPTARNLGVYAERQLAPELFGAAYAAGPDFHQSEARRRMHEALSELTNAHLVEAPNGMFYRLTQSGDAALSDPSQVWELFCRIPLKDDQAHLLKVVNRLSQRMARDYASKEFVREDTLLAELAWEGGLELLRAVSRELAEQKLVESTKTIGPISLAATYQGLVWEQRRAAALESREIDQLVGEWETTSVEFKRELNTKTADQKAELIKDVLALANTQASGSRLLVVGFDDKTRQYHASPDQRITQEHLEQLMSQYTGPAVNLRYSEVGYRSGPVGRLEILRDPKKVPYGVAKSIGDKKRVAQGDVFVRHGSLSEPPTSAELEAIVEEGRRARGETP